MTLHEEIQKLISSVWKERSHTPLKLYKGLVKDFVPGSAHFITIPRLLQIDGFSELPYKDIWEYMGYFSGSGVKLFEPGFMRFTDKDEPYELPLYEVLEALKSGNSMYDEEADELIEDVSKEVYVFFRGTKRFEQILKEKN